MSALEAGQTLPELKVTPDKYLTTRYAGASGDFNPIHIDDEFAQSVGLPGRILHGLWMMSQVARAVGAAGDGHPEALRSLSIQFRGMGFPEQELSVSATVKDVTDGVATVEAEAFQDGRRIIRKGQATLRVG
jgi:acyl dehydratase